MKYPQHFSYRVILVVLSLMWLVGAIGIAKAEPSWPNPSTTQPEKSPVFPWAEIDARPAIPSRAGIPTGSNAPPVNDDFDQATTVATMPDFFTQSTAEATLAADDPDMGCGYGRNSKTVWFRWNATASGPVLIHTFNSDYDTVLAVFTGSRGALSLVGCNDDSEGTLQSLVRFTSSAGTTYWIEVAAYGSRSAGTLWMAMGWDPAQQVTISNADLSVDLDLYGLFRMETADEQALTYPGFTSFISVKVGNSVYSHRDGSLNVVQPTRRLSSSEAEVVFRTREDVEVRQRFTLSGQTLRLWATIYNRSSQRWTVGVRYLIDTQVGVNDGAPLMAPNVGVRTYETDLPAPPFINWFSYDRYPDPLLIGYGTLDTPPTRMVFAWWPTAVDSLWDYNPNPNQAFYTPGYTRSPESDSAVLIYLTESAEPLAEYVLSTYYGSGPAPAESLRRQRVVRALNDLRMAVKSSLAYEMDLAAAALARYVDTTTPQEWEIALRAAVDIAQFGLSTAVGRLTPRFRSSAVKMAELIRPVAYGSEFAHYFAAVMHDLPPELSLADTQARIRQSLASGIPVEDEVNARSYTGLDALSNLVDDQYELAVSALPDPLPENYPVETVIKFIDTQIVTLTAAREHETWVPIYESDTCRAIKLGALIQQTKLLDSLLDTYETGDRWSDISTYAQGLVLAAGGIAKAVITVKTGGFALATELAIWGKVVTVNEIISLFEAGGDAITLSTEANMAVTATHILRQLIEDSKLLVKIHGDTAQWVIQPLRIADLKAMETASAIFIEGLDVANISTESLVGEQTALLRVRNNSSTPVTAVAYGDILAALAGGETVSLGLVLSPAVTIPPGQEGRLPLTVQVLRSSLSDKYGYALAVSVVATDSTGGLSWAGPVVRQFAVGTPAQLAAMADQQTSQLMSGTLSSGEVRTQPLTLQPNTANARLTLYFSDGSDLDLHLYDAQGRHTGLNYATGRLDEQIPGTRHSGPSGTAEYIELQPQAGQSYTAQVVAISAAGSQGYAGVLAEVPARPAWLDVTPWVEIVTEDPVVGFVISLHEYGGHSSLEDLRATPSSLTGPAGVIPASRMQVALPDRLAAGAISQATATIEVPANIEPGRYSGSLTFYGRDSATGQTVSAQTRVILDVRRIYRAYLPTLCRLQR